MFLMPQEIYHCQRNIFPLQAKKAQSALLVRGYYAVQNTPFPALYGTTAVLLSIPENDRCFYVRYRILVIAKQSPFLDRLRKIVYPFLSI